VTRREGVYAVLAVLGLLVPGYFNMMYVVHGGSLLNPLEFFGYGWQTPAARSITTDLFISYFAFVAFALVESRRIGMRRGWAYPLAALALGMAAMFPLFLLVRERHLRRSPGA